jgi:hypothetical protein
LTRKIAIRGYKLDKDGKRLVPCFKHLPVNMQLQRRASAGTRVRSAKSR